MIQKRLKRVHFTGIKGVGMTALALCLKDLGIEVDGSDVEEVFVTDKILKENNIVWKKGFSKENIKDVTDLLITTAAHGGLSNIEVVKAQEQGVCVLTYAQALADISKGKELIATCGVGGKTTTASILAVLLNEAKLNPSFVVGVGNIYPLKVPGKYNNKGKYFICEADDYVVSPGIDDTPKFMLLDPKILVVSNIEYDHPDVYESFTKTKTVFRKFFNKIPREGLIVACIDNSNTRNMVKDLKVPVTTFGFNKDADWVISNLITEKESNYFDLCSKKYKKLYKSMELKIPGEFNVQNAVGAFLAARSIGADEGKLLKGLSTYEGCRRRFEKMGKIGDALFIDDYAHHPNEIRSTLKMAKDWYPQRRIIAIFQPHTFTRTKALFYGFSKSFSKADIIILMDIYSSAREKYDSIINSEKLFKEIKKYKDKVYYLGSGDKVVNWIKRNIMKDDVVITMGAGDIFHIYDKLFI